MRRAVFLLSACTLAAQPALGSQERILSPRKVSLVADAGAPFGEVCARIETATEAGTIRFASVELELGGQRHRVPAKGLSGLGFVMLQKVELRTERGWDDAPWLYVYAEVAEMQGSQRWITKKVHFAFHKGRFEYRSISTPDGKGAEKWDKLELQ
ncbi:MAG: hypothetical protein JXR96_23850 [Deltaproteobacteria bacterium]|nr:hypothetical protein [Deltaproteobacteria bacterium]